MEQYPEITFFTLGELHDFKNRLLDDYIVEVSAANTLEDAAISIRTSPKVDIIKAVDRMIQVIENNTLVSDSIRALRSFIEDEAEPMLINFLLERITDVVRILKVDITELSKNELIQLLESLDDVTFGEKKESLLRALNGDYHVELPEDFFNRSVAGNLAKEFQVIFEEFIKNNDLGRYFQRVKSIYDTILKESNIQDVELINRLDIMSQIAMGLFMANVPRDIQLGDDTKLNSLQETLTLVDGLLKTELDNDVIEWLNKVQFKITGSINGLIE